MKILKRYGKILFLILGIVMILSGCSAVKLLTGGNSEQSGEKNPLRGKDTDERIVMCMEETYPEHEFSVKTSFDKSKDCGVFQDENGLEFKVHGLVYDNTYHFGCENDYLATILRNEDYVDKAAEIAQRYGYVFEYDAENETTGLTPENENRNENENGLEEFETEEQKNPAFDEAAKMILEILNAADSPEVVEPEDTGFSTGEVNFYSFPCMSVLGCDISYKGSSTYVRFSFEDKNLSEDQIRQRFEETWNWLKEEVDNENEEP